MKIVVIGNGMVGQRFVEELVSSTDENEITVLSEEPRTAYDRVHLSEFFNGKSAKDLAMCDENFFATNQIKLSLADSVEVVDRDRQVVLTQNGKKYTYDILVLATGSYPFVPPIQGAEQEHCHVYRTIEDLEKIRASAKESKVGVVVGGGLLGLEAAKALKDLKLETHVVEFAPYLMATQLDPGGGALLENLIKELGVAVHTGKNTVEISEGKDCRYRMVFADGSELETDLILFSAGIRPRDEIAKNCELEVGPRGGIVVDNYCQTSDPSIFAIGECALWNGRIFGLVAPGYQMAKVVAERLIGKDSSFTGADMSTKLKLLGIEVGSIGDSHARTPGALTYTWQDGASQVYKKIIVNQDQTRLLGAVLVGDTSDYGNLLQLVLNDIKLPEYPDALITPQHGDSAVGIGVDALPETAQICSCNNVAKGEICSAVQSGAQNLAEIKSQTKAATSCGGCAPLVNQLMDSELEKMGIHVDHSLCPHFNYTRQELYHIIRTENIRTFQQMITLHGKGFGCEICKPAIGSILASCWNEYVLKKEHAQLQDTNDFYLANMQKNGTYSIVPRVPGGEITPDKLLVIANVAKKFDLYTKITGAQRIDLFGAQLHELPLIWKELVDAGFESGHAYGKALRTVKSCVGDTWCRFGVQDSVSMAINIEKRYRGIRAPHKIKMAVSGCTRECAEAQSKDIGVIATESGWNLFVAGNGGMKPRHADLFAVDLDDETLIKYIDRILMFYIKTADRLQRTSTWMNNLEGGLDYLKKVIIDDHLNICAELENQMQALVDTYACEWKRTIEDEEKVKRYRHFVNSDAEDEQVIFVRERDQKRPAKREEKETLVS